MDEDRKLSSTKVLPLSSFPILSSSPFTNAKQAFWYPFSAVKFLLQPSHRSILYFTLLQSLILFLLLALIGSISFYSTYAALHYFVFTPQRIPTNQWVRLWKYIPINLYWTYTLIWFFICCFTTVMCWLIALIPIRALIDNESKKVSEFVEEILLAGQVGSSATQPSKHEEQIENVIHRIRGLDMESMIENVTKQIVKKEQGGNFCSRLLNYFLELYLHSFFQSIFKFVRRYTMRIGFYFFLNALGTIGYLIPFFHLFQFFVQAFILICTTLLQVALLVFDIILDRKQFSFVQVYLFVLKHFLVLQSYALGLILLVLIFPPILICMYPIAITSATALFLQLQMTNTNAATIQQNNTFVQGNLITLLQETFIQPVLQLFTKNKKKE